MGLPLAIEEGDGEIRESTDAPGSPGPMRYSDLSLKDLVCRCADDPRDHEAWEEFVSRVDKPIALTPMRTASLWVERSLSVVEDLRQDTYMKLCKDDCRRLRDFAIQHPDDDAILRYIKKTAANATIDHFRHSKGQRFGGDRPHVSTDDVDPEDSRSQERIHFRILVEEIDELLKQCLTGPDRERDWMIFWLYFRQGMSCEEIASLPTIGLTDDGVGSVIERLKRCIRERIVGFHSSSSDDEE